MSCSQKEISGTIKRKGDSVDTSEKIILRSIRRLLETEPSIRMAACRGKVQRIKTKWELYSAIRDQSKYAMEEIREENRRQQEYQIYKQYGIRGIHVPGIKLHSAAQFELETIIRTVTKMEPHKKAYDKPVEAMHNTGSLYGFFEKSAKQISIFGKVRAEKSRR